MFSFSLNAGQTELRVSHRSDRTGSMPLANSILMENAYIFIEPENNVKQVSFYLDDPDLTELPAQIEDVAPFDLGGTGPAGEALPFDISVLPEGEHLIVAVVDFFDSTTETASATFNVLKASFPPEISLFFSFHSDRAEPDALYNASLSGDVAIFAAETDTPVEVQFYLDDPEQNRMPFGRDYAAPFDLAGTTEIGHATLFPTTSFENGIHQVTAVAVFADGSKISTTATFTVNNEDIESPPEVLR